MTAAQLAEILDRKADTEWDRMSRPAAIPAPRPSVWDLLPATEPDTDVRLYCLGIYVSEGQAETHREIGCRVCDAEDARCEDRR